MIIVVHAATTNEHFHTAASHSSLEALQKALDEWMAYYNNERTHQGKMCHGRTPIETLLDKKQFGQL